MEGSKSPKNLGKAILGLALDVTCWGASQEEILGLSGQPSPLDGREGGSHGSGHWAPSCEEGVAESLCFPEP